MSYAAIDPGAVNAAIAVFRGSQPVHVDDIPTVNGMLDPVALAKVLEDWGAEAAVVENVHAMPKQGLSSTFRFGMGCGIIHGVCGALRLPMVLVTPSSWKGFHGLNGQKDNPKEASRALALHKWPHLHKFLDRKKDADRAEALLIGDWYYVRVIVPRFAQPEP